MIRAMAIILKNSLGCMASVIASRTADNRKGKFVFFFIFFGGLNRVNWLGWSKIF